MAKKRKPNERADYGTGSIYQNKDGSFTVAVRPWRGAKPIRRRAPDRASAEALKAELIKLRSAKVNLVKGAQPVEDFTAYWYGEVYLQRGRAERSNKHTLDMLELHILPVIARRPLMEVSYAELQALLNNLRRRQRPLGPQTIHHVYSVLKQVFGKALQMEYIERDPTIGLEMPDIVRSEKPSLTIAHVQALLTAVEGHPHAVAYHLMAFLGLRLGEALAVRRTDFNTDFSEVYITQAVDYHTHEMGTPKRESKRRLPVPTRLAALCRAQWGWVREGQHDSAPDFTHQGLLIPSETGTPIQSSNFEKLWRGYTVRRRGKRAKTYTYQGFREKAGLPDGSTLHDLRRFLATALEDLDVGQRTIGHILGHKAKNVTEVYIRRNLPTMRRALEKLEAAVWADKEDQGKTG